jgi:hypothetical protein
MITHVNGVGCQFECQKEKLKKLRLGVSVKMIEQVSVLSNLVTIRGKKKFYNSSKKAIAACLLDKKVVSSILFTR